MAKILTDIELVDIIRRATADDAMIDCADSYEHFLRDLAQLVCDYFGGQVGSIECPGDGLPWTVEIHIDENVPADGGAFSAYDPDITWKGGKEW